MLVKAKSSKQVNVDFLESLFVVFLLMAAFLLICLMSGVALILSAVFFWQTWHVRHL
jgi:hypothetical protein